jgi:hypothetical protein
VRNLAIALSLIVLGCTGIIFFIGGGNVKCSNENPAPFSGKA